MAIFLFFSQSIFNDLAFFVLLFQLYARSIMTIYYNRRIKQLIYLIFKVNSNLDLYIAVISQIPYSKRIISLFQAWGEEFANKSGSMIKIFTLFNETNSTYIPLKYWKYITVKGLRFSSYSYRLVYYLNFASAHDFFKNTNLRWYLRTTYDNYIHLPNLYKFIEKLNSQYDPETEIVMKGDHIGYFIHGGPGWIMSRYAVKKYIDIEKQMTENYNSFKNADDENIMMFVNEYRLLYNNIYTPQFSGWPVKDSSYQQLIQSNFSYSKIIFPCRKNLHPKKVNKLVVWHNGRKKDYVNTIGKRIINEAPDNLGIHYHLHTGGEFCIFSKSIDYGDDSFI